MSLGYTYDLCGDIRGLIDHETLHIQKNTTIV